MTDREPGRVQSVVKAMELLNCLAQAGGPLSLGELSRRTGIPKATVHGLLAAMRPSSVVEQSGEDGRYRLGTRLFEYGCAVSSGWNVLEAAAEPMRRAAEETGETVSLAALDGDSVLILDSAVAHGNYRVASQRGARLPLHCTSQGKLLLAFLPPQRRRALLRTCRFEDYTPHSHRSAEALETDLARIREQGFALENGEFRIGLRSVSAPVFNVEGQAAYALCAVGMFRRMDAPELERATQLVRETARRISFDLGYRGGSSHP